MLAFPLQHVAWATACVACALAGIGLGRVDGRVAESTLHADAMSLATAALAHQAATGRSNPSCAPAALTPCIGDWHPWSGQSNATFWIEADDETTGFTAYGIRYRDQRRVFYRVQGSYPR